MDAQHGFEAPQSPHEDRGCCFIEAELLVWERSFLPSIMIEVLVDDQDEVASKRNEVQVFFVNRSASSFSCLFLKWIEMRTRRLNSMSLAHFFRNVQQDMNFITRK